MPTPPVLSLRARSQHGNLLPLSRFYGPAHAASLASAPAVPPRKRKRQISDRQLAANRANARKSTGPVTSEGKAKSSVNAFRHGLTGQVSVKTDEDRAAHKTFCEAIVTDLQPEGALEEQLAQSIAEGHWRLNRVRAMEDNIFALGHYTPAADIDAGHPELHAALTSARVFLESARDFERLTLYEQRIHRSLQKDLAQLETLQAKRKAARAEALSEAAQIARVASHYQEEQPEQMAVNGFVFSKAEIDRHTHRDRSLRCFEFHEKHHWNQQIAWPEAA